MKFVDEVRIYVKAGDGGNGSVAFRREKFIEKGGPSGGDGGDGGSIWFTADPQLTTLLDFRYQQHHRARNGEHGMGSDCNGRGADDMELKVPVGTLIRNEDTGELLYDLSEPGQRVLVAKGGRGGLGNMNFATSTRQTPRFAQDGTPGEELTLRLELRLLADVGLIGYPNAGKSTLISVVSRAKPRIADYPFTTLVPNLGMVQYRDAHSFVMADIPGLIEGASEGAGLGLQFLRHVERCRVLVHVVDLGAWEEERTPVGDFDVINRELANYSPELAEKPQVVVASKIDLPHAQEKLPAFVKEMEARGLRVYPISAATHEGLQPLLDAVGRVLFSNDESLLKVEVEEPWARSAKPAKGAAEEAASEAEASKSAKKAAPKTAGSQKSGTSKTKVAASKPAKKTAAKAAPKSATSKKSEASKAKVAASKPAKKTAAKAAPKSATSKKSEASKAKATASKAAAKSATSKTSAASKAKDSKPAKKAAAKSANPKTSAASKAKDSKPAKKAAAKSANSKKAETSKAKATASKSATKAAAAKRAVAPQAKSTASTPVKKPASKAAPKAAAAKKSEASKAKATASKPAKKTTTKAASKPKAAAKKTVARAKGKNAGDAKAAAKPEKKGRADKGSASKTDAKKAPKTKASGKKAEATRGGKRG